MIWMRILFSFAFMASVVSSAAEGKTEAYRAVIGSDGIQHVEMVGGGYFFKPSHIIVKVNVPVELTVKKETGIVPHNIVMKEPAAGMEFEVSLSSEPQIIKFTPTKTGIYPFYCSKKPPLLKSHREKGMEGKLEVVE